ncbi:MAG: LysR family transcriptional regulator [Clostridia bacterium]|nr:LysR family transcriptional regulator [Clostridia bacterium]
MDITKCKALVLSLDLGSFSAAGEQLGYTASGITKMVNNVEEEVGFPIVSRSNKGIELTSDGEKILPIFRHIIHEEEKVNQISAEISGLVKGHIRVGTYYSIAAAWLPEVLKGFEDIHPDITIDTVEEYNRNLITMLETGRIDCCFFAYNPAFKGDWIPLKEDELVAWLPKNHPLAKGKTFPVKALSAEKFIHTRPGQDTELDRFLREKKIKPNTIFTTSDAFTTYSMVEAGLGISFNNRLVTSRWDLDVVTMPFDEPKFVSLGIAVPSMQSASPATKKFIKYAKEVIKEKLPI